MAETVEVKGLRELRRAMLTLPQKMDQRILNSGLLAGGRLIVADAKQRVAVRTGELRRNIRARSTKPFQGMTATVIVGVRKLTKKQIAALKKKRNRKGSSLPNPSDPFYWRFLEFGTSKMRARPFLRPAFESKKGQALEVITKQFAKRVEEEAARLAR